MPLMTTKCQIVGLRRYHAPDLICDLNDGRVQFTGIYNPSCPPAVFVPEPENPREPRAIRVDIPGNVLSDHKPRKLGYIPDNLLNTWHPFIAGTAPVRPKLSSAVAIQTEAQLPTGALWDIFVSSFEPGLPGPEVPAPRLRHNFLYQAQAWPKPPSQPSAPLRPKGMKGIRIWV